MSSISSLFDIEKIAKSMMNESSWSFYSAGANKEQTLKENREAFQRYWLRPRVLRNVSCVDLSTSLLGHPVALPVGISPTGIHQMAHSDGELATARASAKCQSLMILSMASNTSIEDAAEANGSGLRWMHINIIRDRHLVESVIHRVEKAGYQAIVVTVDQPVTGLRAYGPVIFPENISFPNLSNVVSNSPVLEDLNNLLDPSATWEDINWIKTLTDLPIVIKGVMTAEDAVEAVKHGVQGIIVSNHGGRQLDGVLASIDALKEVVEAVEGQVEVYMDGGVRQGTDVLKALALGARAVFLGRPVLWGLAYSGQEGVEKVFEILTNELRTAMMLAGW